MDRKKKIGIITLHVIANYGGILQSYALQTVLQRMGYDVEKIELYPWEKALPLWKKVFVYPYRIFRKVVLKQKCTIKREQHQYESEMVQYKQATHTLKFINKHIKRKQIYSYKELDANDYYALVVGSDQIWRPKYLHGARTDIRDSFLNFAKKWDVKRVAYAPSFGTDNCEYAEKELKDCGKLLKLFDGVSVREKSGVELCKRMGRDDASVLLDPTLLLSKEDYIQLVSKDYPQSEGDLFCYVLDKTDETKEAIGYISKEMKLKPFEVIAQTDVESDKEDGFYQPPLEKWLRGFMDAKFVVTDSFHACVFSIIFGKPFVVIANQERGVTRYNTLLKLFHLEERLVYGYDEHLIKQIIGMPFNPDMTQLEEERNRANDYLRKYLGI